MSQKSWPEQFSRGREVALKTVPALTALTGAVLLVALQVPWLEGPLDALNLSDSEGLRWMMIAVVLTTISGQVYELTAIVARTSQEPRRVLRDTVELFPFIEERLSVLKRTERDADLFVAHLNGVLHFLSIVVQRPEFTDCRIRLTASTARGDASRGVLGDEWICDARRNVATLKSLAKSAQIRGRNVRIEIFEYDFAPAIYGVRLGNGDLFITFLRWSDNGCLSAAAGPWEFIPHSDKTPSADGLRDLFDSWFRRALADSSAPSSNEATLAAAPIQPEDDPIRR